MTMDGADAQKRKLEEEKDAASKRSVVPAPMEVDGGAVMKSADFSPELLRIYYDKMFPFQQMFRWLSYRNDPKSSSKSVVRDFFYRREFCFVLEGDIFCRYMCFKDADDFKKEIIARQPIRMEIGAVYSHPPKTHNTVIKDAYKPLERELVFDIDMDDYDDIRTCCTGSKLCMKCWTFMRCGIKVLRRALQEDFGFNHFFFVFSGRRGVHCWVCDEAARKLSNEQRSAVAEYLTVVAGGKGRARADLRMNSGCEELHPAITGAHKICEPFFRDDAMSILAAQDVLRQGPHLSNIMETMSIVEKEAINKFVKENPTADSRAIWLQLEKLAEDRTRAANNHREKAAAKVFLKDVVLQYTYPRLDINVSKQMNHLLKAPFVVHPKTGRVCVPIDPDKLDTFSPFDVPTIGRLVDELNRTGDVRETSMKQYTHFFEKSFLQPMEKAIAEDFRQQADMEF